MKLAAAYFRQKAEHCRQLADAVSDRDDPVVTRLLSMAREFDGNASALERRVLRDAAHLPRDEDVPQLH